MKITVIDYGMGNLQSVVNAFNFLQASCEISSDPKTVAKAETLILPGVGSFRNAMTALQKSGLDHAIKEAVGIRKRKILGICLGLQMLASSSTEDGLTPGLNFIPGEVDRFSSDKLQGLKLPHVGFNKVTLPNSSGLFRGLSQETYFYFVHSYRLLPKNLKGEVAISNYGVEFVAAYQYENIFAAQFHPEKSQTNGLRLLDNFMSS